MKRLLSLVLCFSVALSNFATVASAADQLPVTAVPVQEAAAPEEQPPVPEEESASPEIQTLTEEIPVPEETPAAEEIPAPEETPAAEETPAPEETPVAEETPASEETPAAEETPAPEETPAAEETPAPEETPAAEETPVPEETSAPTATPAPTVTPSTTPTAAPTATPSASPTPTPESTVLPTETVPAQPAQLAGEDVVTVYLDAEAGVYYGRLPVEPNAEGVIQIKNEYLFWSEDDPQYVITVEDGSYWLFVMTDAANSETANLSYQEVSAGETENSEHAVVLGTGEPAQKPPVVVSKKDWSTWASINQSSPLVSAGGTADLSVSASGTILAVYGQNVEVVSGPDDQGNLTIRYPETVTSWENEYGSLAVLWFYVQNSDGTVTCTSQQLPYVPGGDVSVEAYGSGPYWYDLVNGGQAFQASLWLDGQSCVGWSSLGTILEDQITVELTDPNSTAVYNGSVVASYDAEQDAVLVSMSQLPEDLSVNWMLTLRVPCAEGYTLVYAPYGIAKKDLGLSTVSDQLAMGLSAGATYTARVRYYDSDIGDYQWMNFDEGWSATLSDNSSIVKEDGKTIDDYFQVTLNGDSFTVTVLQDVTLKKDSTTLYYTFSNIFYESFISVPLGQPSLWWNGAYPTWGTLLSQEGIAVQGSQNLNEETLSGWACFGTPVADGVTALLTAYSNGETINFTEGLTAVYDPEQDTVIVKADSLPENLDLTWTMVITVPCAEGFNLKLSAPCGKDYLSGRFVANNLLNSVGLKAGSVQEGMVQGDNKENLLTGSGWEITLSSSDIVLGEGETLEDYLQVQVTEENTLRVEVLKDITLRYPDNSISSFRVQMQNDLSNISGFDIYLGAASLNIGLQNEEGYSPNLLLQEQSGWTIYPVVYNEGTTSFLHDLGCQYQVQIYQDNQPYTGDEFQISYNNDGSFRLNVPEIPPLYDFETGTVHQYSIGVLSTDGSFADRTTVGQFRVYGLSVNLYENGRRVYSLPTTQGSHVYEMVLQNLDGDTVELPTGVQTSLDLSLYADGNPVEQCVLQVDPETATLTYNLQQDVAGSGNLSISGYWGERIYIQGSVNAGRLQIQLDSAALETSSSTFGTLGGRWNLSARATGAGMGTNLFYLRGSDLSDAGFEIRENHNGQYTPIQESQYFEASVESGLLTIRVKQAPPANGDYFVSLRYEDGSYTSGDYGINFFYQAEGDNTSTYHSLNFVDLETGKTIYNIPRGEPGTVDEYRVMTDSRYAGDVLGSTLSSFQLTNDAGLSSLDDYLKISYNPTNSLLRLEWQDQTLPLLSANGKTVYNYTLQALDANGNQNHQVSTTSLFSAQPLYQLSDDQTGQSIGTLELQQGISRKVFAAYPLTGTIFAQVKDENFQLVDSGLIQVSIDQYGALEVTASASCPVGNYYLDLNGLYKVDGGTLSAKGTSIAVRVSDTPLNTVQYCYTLDSWSSYSMLDPRTPLSFDKSAPNAKLYLTIYNDTATGFTIDGLTLGTAQAVPGGYAITMTAETLAATETLSETLTLTATLADGSTQVTQTVLEAPVVENGYRIVDGGNVFDATNLFADYVWVVGKEYQIYPLLNGKTLTEAGVTLNSAFLENEDLYTITGVDPEQGCFTMVPVKAISGNSYNRNNLYMNLMRANGDLYATQSFVTNGTNLANNNRQQFINQASGRKVDSLAVSEGKCDFSLALDEDPDNIASIEYGTNVPDSVTWDKSGTTTVQLHVAPYIQSDDNYFYAVITRKDGTMTSASVSLVWSSMSYPVWGVLPDGNRIYFGTKNEDASYSRWNASYYSQSDNATSTNKLYIFFGRDNSQDSQYEEWPDIVKSIQVTSESDAVQILRQGMENGMWFFEYQVDRNNYGRWEMTATVTTQDGSTRYDTYEVAVCENAAENTVTVTNADQLQAALQSATLLPGTTILLENGVYEGDFVVDLPSTTLQSKTMSVPSCTADGTLTPGSGVTLKGSITAKADLMEVRGINFQGSGTALTDPGRVYNCTFQGYDTAMVLEKEISSTQSHVLSNNIFVNNGTAMLFEEREWYTSLKNNTFCRNDVALALSADCVIDGDYSTIYNVITTSGSMVKNLFYLADGQLALQNRSANQATVNLSYNYFEQDGVGIPQAAQFSGAAIYSPYYETAACASITTSDVLEDNVEEGTTTSVLTLVAGQGTSDTNTADSSLQLGTGKFEDLKNSQSVDSLQINVQSTSNETDVIWNFDKQDLNPDYADTSVNLGVAFSFTDFEYDAIDQIVRKSTEDTTEDPGTGEPVSETLDSIAYQAMCFAHSGALPGTATVKVRMNESLLDYYATHGNSMEGFRIYYFNEQTGKLEIMDQQITVTNENNVYYMSFRIDHCSSYLVTNQELDTDISGFNTIRLNEEDDGGYILADGILDRVEPGTTVAEVLSHLVGGSMTVLDGSGNAVAETALMSTGCTIGLGDGSISPVTVVVGGDVIPTGTVNVDDLLEVRRAVLEMVELEGVTLKAAAMLSGEERPTVNDLLQVRRYALEMIDQIYEG